jgi:hypothetical protein
MDKMQPLDEGFFGPMKQTLRKQLKARPLAVSKTGAEDGVSADAEGMVYCTHKC